MFLSLKGCLCTYLGPFLDSRSRSAADVLDLVISQVDNSGDVGAGHHILTHFFSLEISKSKHSACKELVF